MLKTLLKKQLLEFGRSFIYDEKNKKTRSRGASVAFIAAYFVLIFGVLGGMFTYLSVSLCEPLFGAGVGWMYYAILGLMGIALGTFGSVFNTFSTLYSAKDNDLLLSMPIPEKYIIVSRLSSVYILGTVFSVIVTVPATVVGFTCAKPTFLSISGGLLFVVTVSLIVLILSCVLGFFVAKISAKLKRKSFISVLASLLFFAGYYFVYFKASAIIRSITENAAEYGAKIKTSAFPLYFFGEMGTGNLLSIVVCTVLSVAFCVLTCYVISRSFRKIVTTPSSRIKEKKKSAVSAQKSVSRTLFDKEFKRFTSSPNYMLNCALGVVFMIAAAVVFAVKGSFIGEMITETFGLDEAVVPLAFSWLLCFLASMNDTAAASVSLEGKSIWILQSLPVRAKDVLKAKMGVQLAITCPPLFVCSVCAAIALKGSVLTSVLLILLAQMSAFAAAAFDLFLNVKSPNLNWTNEIVPIKQSLCMMMAVFGASAFSAVGALAGYFALRVMSINLVFVLFLVIYAAVGGSIVAWLRKKGAEIFSTLN